MSRVWGRSLSSPRSPLARLFGDKILPVGGIILLTQNSHQGKVNPGASSSLLPSQSLLTKVMSSKQQTNTTGAPMAFPMQMSVKPNEYWKCVPSQTLQKLTQIWMEPGWQVRDGCKPQGCFRQPETPWQRLLSADWSCSGTHSTSESSLSPAACPTCSTSSPQLPDPRGQLTPMCRVKGFTAQLVPPV